MMEESAFEWVDWLLFGLTLAISAGIGLYISVSGGRQKNTSEYFTANRNLWVVPTAMSMIMSWLSATSLVGVATEYYLYGTQTSMSIIAFFFIYSFAAAFIVPHLYRLKITSIFQYLHLRYKSPNLRRLCVFFQCVGQIFFLGLVIYVPSTSVEAVTGFATWANVLIVSGVATVYTAIGGMKAIVWTDMIQGTIVIAGLIALAAVGTREVGSFTRVWELVREGGRLNFFNFDPDPTTRMTFWTNTVGLLLYAVTFGTNQHNVQRYSSLPTLTKARLCVLLMLPIDVIITLLLFIVSLVLYAYYHNLGCDPLRSGQIYNPNQLFPFFVASVLRQPGIPGLFFAVMFSAALSTMSSVMNGLAAVVWKDLIEPRKPHMQEHKKLTITKSLVFLIGGLGTATALFVQIIPGTIFVIMGRVLGGFAVPVNTVLWLALFFPCTNASGAIAGGLASFALSLWMGIGAFLSNPHQYHLPTIVENCTTAGNVTFRPNPTDPPADSIFWLYRVSHQLTGPFGLTVGVIVGVTVSLILGGPGNASRDRRLVIPVAEYLCCCLPKSLRRALWCGISDDHAVTDEINLDKEYDQAEQTGVDTKDEVYTVSFRGVRGQNDSGEPVQLKGFQNKSFTSL